MDEKQIPPVGKKQETGESHAIPFLPARQQAHRIKVFSLTEPQRQAKESPIIMYSVAIREQADRQKIDFDFTPEMLPALEHIPSSQQSLPYLRELFLKYFATPEFEEDQDYVKVIAYTNKTVNWFNKEIRLLINNVETLPKIIDNEKLILDEPVMDKDGKTILMHTNDEVVTENVVIDEMEIKYRLYPANAFEEEKLMASTGDAVIKKVLPIKIYRATLIGEQAKHRVAIIHEDSEQEFKDVRDRLKDSAKQSFNKYHTKDLWSQFYNIGKSLAWVKYNYAITAHKSQGSTYDYALSMEMDIEKNFDIEERNRIRYVAATRARHKLYVIK